MPMLIYGLVFLFSCLVSVVFFLPLLMVFFFFSGWESKEILRVDEDSMDVIDKGEGGMHEGIYLFVATNVMVPCCLN